MSRQNDIIDWEEYFMAIALVAAKRSKDPVCQVGACIVNKGRQITGIGYNGMPLGLNGCDPFTWEKGSHENDKSLFVCHAEMNAIAFKTSADVKDCTIYVTLFPCNECAKIIIQSGIKTVIYLSNRKGHKPKYIASKKMFDAAGVNCRKYEPKNKTIIVINFAVD